jgi:hypothetical protein
MVEPRQSPSQGTRLIPPPIGPPSNVLAAPMGPDVLTSALYPLVIPIIVSFHSTTAGQFSPGAHLGTAFA